MAYSKPWIGIWFSDQVLSELLGMIGGGGGGGGCKSQNACGRRLSVFYHNLMHTKHLHALGEASEAYGSDSVTGLILGCSGTAVKADLNQNVSDFEERTLAVMMTLKSMIQWLCRGKWIAYYIWMFIFCWYLDVK